MIKQLDDNYNISVDNMLPITNTIEGFNVYETSFGNNVKMKVLKNDIELGTHGCKQIFKMKDGKFILEVEDYGDVFYLYSNDINDLIAEPDKKSFTFVKIPVVKIPVWKRN